MSATTSSRSWLRAPLAERATALRFAQQVGVDAAGLPSLQWLLRRNCSLAPSRLIAVFASLGLLVLAIATLMWALGATLVLPFAALELAALALALVAYARHAVDGECLLLGDGRLTVERVDGSRTERLEFDAAALRVQTLRDERSLIELAGPGRRIAVGRFVRPEWREALARELRVAVLRRAHG